MQQVKSGFYHQLPTSPKLSSPLPAVMITSSSFTFRGRESATLASLKSALEESNQRVSILETLNAASQTKIERLLRRDDEFERLKAQIKNVLGEQKKKDLEAAQLPLPISTGNERRQWKQRARSLSAERALKGKHLDIANTWRVILVFGGMLASGFAVCGYLLESEQVAWATPMFWPLSFCCQFVAYLPNGVRNLKAWREKFVIGFCGLLVGLSPFFFGLTLMAHEDQHTSSFERFTARAGLGMGMVCMVIFPLMNFGMASKYNALPEKKLLAALTEIWHSLPRVCGSLLYLSSSSLRCIMREGADTLSVPKRCANPIFPTMCIMVLLTNTWAIAYVKSPVNKAGHNTTFHDLVALRMPMARGAQLVAFGACGVIALVLFSITDEQGSEMSPLLGSLMALLGGSLVVAVLIDVFEVYVKPLVFPGLAAVTVVDEGERERAGSRGSRSDVRSLSDSIGSI
jgi:hypothetical protein